MADKTKKVKLTRDVILGAGKKGKAGEVIEVSTTFANELVANSQGVLADKASTQDGGDQGKGKGK